mmetsp:Transcript_12377/g.20081  ORF Transcript_12377/g.20081 Transcript_12377/m.20081 type:complete len:537 (+) Transcript_12377:39-1649(+)
MPELPEAEQGRRIAERHLLNKSIVAVWTAHDEIVFEGVQPQKFAGSITGRTVVKACRKGKQMWFELDERPWPTFHFGMDGNFVAYEDEEDRPRFCKCELLMDDGIRFAFTNVRRLGRIRLQKDPANESPVTELGFDPLTEMPLLEDFSALLQQRSAPIKAVLLDQRFAAGVGNWIADEVLYQARVAPQVPVKKLTAEQVEAIHRNLKFVVHTAVSLNANGDAFPSDWLFHIRWSKGTKIVPKTVDGHALAFATVGGRTSAYVPALQKGANLAPVRKKAAKKRTKVLSDEEEEEDAPEGLDKGKNKKRRKGKPQIGDGDVDEGQADGGETQNKQQKGSGTRSRSKAIDKSMRKRTRQVEMKENGKEESNSNSDGHALKGRKGHTMTEKKALPAKTKETGNTIIEEHDRRRSKRRTLPEGEAKAVGVKRGKKEESITEELNVFKEYIFCPKESEIVENGKGEEEEMQDKVSRRRVEGTKGKGRARENEKATERNATDRRRSLRSMADRSGKEVELEERGGKVQQAFVLHGRGGRRAVV